MTKGRRPKPTALKVATGNPGGRRLNAAEPQLDGRTTPPTWLDKIARQEWRRLAPRLERHRLLTPADRTLFALYCRAYSRLVRAERFLRAQESLVFKTKAGTLKAWPHEAIANAAADQLRHLAAEFGLSPASRSRIALPEHDPTRQAGAFLFGAGEDPAGDPCAPGVN